MRTRRQLIAERIRKFPIIIPAKSDLSPFQKSGRSIEGLPTSIFSIIQTFLSETDYRGLMNSNLATFQPIKFETVRYSLLNPEALQPSDLIPTHKQREFFINILNSVKDKSKQIKLKMRLSTSSIIENQGTFRGIRKLELIGKHVGVQRFDFTMFNNIYEVVLKSFNGVRYITEGFEGVVKLDISDFRSLISITNINTNKTLRQLVITDCSSFKGLEQSMDGISHVTCNLEIKFSRLESFRGPTQLKPFHGFDGETLFLQGVNLSLWSETIQSGSSFQNLLSLSLIHCENIRMVPHMPSLRELNLCQCYPLNFIPSYPELKVLHLEGLNIVSISSIQPNLKDVQILSCSYLKDVAFAGNTTTIRLFKLDECPRVKDISMLGYIKYLKIRYCEGVRSVVGLSGRTDNNKSDERTIILIDLPNLKDFSPLHDIHRLELISMRHFNDNHRIYNIDHLFIDLCDISSSRNLVNIRKSLVIQGCKNYCYEEDRNDIPVVKCQSYRTLDSLFRGPFQNYWK